MEQLIDQMSNVTIQFVYCPLCNLQMIYTNSLCKCLNNECYFYLFPSILQDVENIRDRINSTINAHRIIKNCNGEFVYTVDQWQELLIVAECINCGFVRLIDPKIHTE